jgi:DNA-binding GntR family transcriptional regulator
VTGRLPVMAGTVTVKDRDVTNWRGHLLSRMGLGFVPQTKDVFDTLTVTENLEMGGYLLVLRDLITDRRLSPGTPLRQRRLAEQFDVSYTPVREALRRLESKGLVVTDVHRGATVARTESEELEENYRILAALEALAGSRAAAKITDDDIADIEALYREVAACLPDDHRLAELNRQFHFRIYECARSPMLLLLMRLLWRSFPHGPQAGRPHQESVRQHDALVQAPKHRSEAQVAAVIRDHVLGSIKYLPRR